MTLEGGVTTDRVFIWCDYKRRDYRQGLTVTQSITYLLAETTYKSVYQNFLACLEEDNHLKSLKYDAFRKL